MTQYKTQQLRRMSKSHYSIYFYNNWFKRVRDGQLVSQKQELACMHHSKKRDKINKRKNRKAQILQLISN